MSDKNEKQVGRPRGLGAITAGPESYKKFAEIWNTSEDTGEKLTLVAKGGKNAGEKVEVGGVMATILRRLREVKIADEHTDPAQVRAFATRVRDAKIEVKAFAIRMDRKLVCRAWQTAKSPTDAFEKALKMGLFKDDEVASEEDRAAKYLSFRACVSQLRKAGVPLKKLGRERASSISNEKFIEAWNSSNSVAEVKDKLVEAGEVKEDCKLSTLKSKFKTLNEKHNAGLKKLKSGAGINELAKYAASLLEDENAEFADENEDEDEDEDEAEEDEVGDDDDVSEDEDILGGLLA